MNPQSTQFEWPAPLRRFVTKGTNGLRLPSRAPYRSVWFWLAIPFGLMFATIGVIGIAGPDGPPTPISVIVGICALVFAAAVFESTAYSAWGTVEIERFDTHWIVTRWLGKWARSLEFDEDHIRSVDLDTPYSYGIAISFPGSAGRQVYVSLNCPDRLIKIGAGLFLEEETLQALQLLLNPPGGDDGADRNESAEQ